MNRQAYAWFHAANGSSAAPMPSPPLFSRHVEFIPSPDDLRRVSIWWKPQDVNRTVGAAKYRTSASDLSHGHRPTSVTWLRNTSWFIDVSHGGTPNLWTNICHWSNTIFPFFEAVVRGEVCHRPLQNVFLWQVPMQMWAKMPEGYHRGTLEATIRELGRHPQIGATSPPIAEPTHFFFDEDIASGMTFCFDEVVVVREPNLQHRKLILQTRSSMSTAGVARGFSTRDARYAFRRAVLAHLRVPPPEPRVPTVTHLSRPFGVKDAKLHGHAWQLRCHIKPSTFRKLQSIVFQASGYRMVRAVFERTTYAYQAKVMSETDIFWASHGAGMVHLPLLPKDAVAIEMFNCGHFSYLYANLALNLGVRYFTMQRTEPWCYRPSTLYGDTRKNMSKTYAYTQAEAEPILMQAVRYHMWQDPTPDVSGRERRCESALKILRGSGALPIGMPPSVHACANERLLPSPHACPAARGRFRVSALAQNDGALSACRVCVQILIRTVRIVVDETYSEAMPRLTTVTDLLASTPAGLGWADVVQQPAHTVDAYHKIVPFPRAVGIHKMCTQSQLSHESGNTTEER